MKAYFVQERRAGKWHKVSRRSLMGTYESKGKAKHDIRNYLRRHADASTGDYRILAINV